VRITLTGGEPTLWPELDKFAKYLHDNHKCRITLNTNGSRTVRWWKQYSKYFDDIEISVHNEFADISHIIQVLDEIYSQGNIMVAAQVLMDPKNWNKSVENVNRLVEHSTPWLVKLMTLTKPLTGEVMDYTQEQLQYLQKKIQKKPPKEYIDLMFSTGKIIEDDRITYGTMTYEDGTTVRYNTFEIFKNNLNQFQNWSCDIGSERIGIHANGVLAGNCGEQISDMTFNLHDAAFADTFSLKNIRPSSICTRQFCDCTSDIRVSKRKN
jgi:organic radical activating enzyme